MELLKIVVGWTEAVPQPVTWSGNCTQAEFDSCWNCFAANFILQLFFRLSGEGVTNLEFLGKKFRLSLSQIAGVNDSHWTGHWPLSDHHDWLPLVSLATPDANVIRNSSQRTTSMATLSWQWCQTASCRPKKLSGDTRTVMKPASSRTTSLSAMHQPASAAVRSRAGFNAGRGGDRARAPGVPVPSRGDNRSFFVFLAESCLWKDQIVAGSVRYAVVNFASLRRMSVFSYSYVRQLRWSTFGRTIK